MRQAILCGFLLFYCAGISSAQSQSLIEERKFLFGIETRVGGLTALGVNSPLYTTGISAVNLLFSVPVYGNLVIHAQFRTAFPYERLKPPLGNSVPMIFQSSLTLGLFVGLGGRIYDNRHTAAKSDSRLAAKSDSRLAASTPGKGRGWTLWLHGGFILDYGVHNTHLQKPLSFSVADSLYQMFSLGAEVNFQAVYHFAPKAGFFLSLFFDLRGAPFAGDPFYQNYARLQVPFALGSWGMGVGFLF